MTVAAHDGLERSLENFKRLVNDHPRLRSLLKGWDRKVRVECEDSDLRYRMVFVDTRLENLVRDTNEAVADIVLRAAEATLVDMFEGRGNPATLFLDGALQVFASDKDQIKLDAISLLLWD